MISKVVSFGFKHGAPKPQDGSGHVFDVRPYLTSNPYHIARLKALSGLTPAVQAFVGSSLGVNECFNLLVRRAKEGNGTLWIGCTGGFHRSVVMAEMVGKYLSIPVEHRDMGKHS